MSGIVALDGLIAVMMRGLVLSAQSLTLGGVVFLLLVVPSESELSNSIGWSVERWIKHWALLLAVVDLLSVGLNIAVLMESGGFAFREVLTANFTLAGSLAAASSLVIVILSSTRSRRRKPILFAPATLILAAGVMTSHAMARLDHRLPLIVLTAAHQAATAAWIGGIPFLLISLRRLSAPAQVQELCARFSQLAMVSVCVLAVAGLGLARFYVGSWDAVYGATYGIMVVGKVVLFGILLGLGALNFRIVRRLDEAGSLVRSLWRFGEVEIGIGFTVILLAASLTSLAPAIDTNVQDSPVADMVSRMAPQPPRLWAAGLRESAHPADGLETGLAASKPLLEKSSASRQSPGDQHPPNEVRWMDDPHHWAALVVMPVGLLALLGRSKRFAFALNWPLLFPALGLVLLLMSDSQYWPLGPGSFWSSFLDPTILPHRIIEILISVFGIFEWRVQTQRQNSVRAGLVFPGLVAFSGALLFAHSHGVVDSQLQEGLVSEAGHISIAVVGITAGWSRWLELRLPAEDRMRRVTTWIWPVCFLVVGILLACFPGDS
jgi:putative copper resistance protein D